MLWHDGYWRGTLTELVFTIFNLDGDEYPPDPKGKLGMGRRV